MEVKMDRDSTLYIVLGWLCSFGGGIICGLWIGVHYAPNSVPRVALQSIERAPADTYIVYRGDHPPSDTTAQWQDTTNPSDSAFGYTLMQYKDGKWKPAFDKPIYKEDYK
jgi:hypothetical protein